MTILNMYASNGNLYKYVIKQKLIDPQRKTDKFTIIVGDLTIRSVFSITDKTTGQKTSKDVEGLNNTINQVDLMDVYTALSAPTAKYTFFSSTHRTFAKIDHIPDHKTNFNNVERIQVIQSVFSDRNGINLEINNRKIAEKSPNI